MTSLVSPTRIKLSLFVALIVGAVYLGLSVGGSGANNIAAITPMTVPAVASDPTAAAYVQPSEGVPDTAMSGSHFLSGVVEGARAGNEDAQEILVKAARRGVEQARRLCERLDLDWKR